MALLYYSCGARSRAGAGDVAGAGVVARSSTGAGGRAPCSILCCRGRVLAPVRHVRVAAAGAGVGTDAWAVTVALLLGVGVVRRWCCTQKDVVAVVEKALGGRFWRWKVGGWDGWSPSEEERRWQRYWVRVLWIPHSITTALSVWYDQRQDGSTNMKDTTTDQRMKSTRWQRATAVTTRPRGARRTTPRTTTPPPRPHPLLQPSTASAFTSSTAATTSTRSTNDSAVSANTTVHDDGRNEQHNGSQQRHNDTAQTEARRYDEAETSTNRRNASASNTSTRV
ncbi:hypothetical protein BD410DRAFT_847020, partial [Rickenella mellea]